MKKNISQLFFSTLFLLTLVGFYSSVAFAAGTITQGQTPPATTSSKPATKPATTSTISDTTVANWGCDQLKQQIQEAGGGRAGELPSYCTEGEVYKKIVYWLYYIVGIGAVGMIIYGGYVYMTSRSNESQVKKGKQILLYTVVGVAISILAITLVTIVINLVVDNKIF
jgi:hypothetical protein